MQVVGHVGLYVGLIVYTALGAKVLGVGGGCHVIFINIIFIYYSNLSSFSYLFLTKQFAVSVVAGTVYIHVQCTTTHMLRMRIILRNSVYEGEKGESLDTFGKLHLNLPH